MKIHQDGGVATTNTPSRKAASFGIREGRAGRTPLQEKNGRRSMRSPYGNSKAEGKPTPFQSPPMAKRTTTTTTTGMTSNSFRQGLKKGMTPSSTKTKTKTRAKTHSTVVHAKENNTAVEDLYQSWKQRQNQPIQKPIQKTPGSASALRRTLRATMKPKGNQQNSEILAQKNRVNLKTSSNIEPFQSVATAMAQSSSYSISSVLGRSRLLGKGGPAPGKSMLGGLGPPARVVPKTPNTLLRTELEDEDDYEESFLLSPPPGALWNALNLAGGDGDGRHSSPLVTTGLIVVSPQAAEQIHTLSSTEKRLSSLDSSPEAISDLTSPHFPKALMQTPYTAASMTTNSVQKSVEIQASKAGRTRKHETPKDETQDISSVTSKTQQVTTNVEYASNSVRESVVPPDTDQVLLRTIEKSTKGGVAMDMTGFFTLDATEMPKKHEKKWVETTPLSKSMPSELLSRLNSKRRTASKKTPSNDTKPPPSVTKGASSKLKPTSKATKPPVTKSSTKVTNKRNVRETSVSTNKTLSTSGVGKENAATTVFKAATRKAQKSKNVLGSKPPTGNKKASLASHTLNERKRQVTNTRVATKSKLSSQTTKQSRLLQRSEENELTIARKSLVQQEGSETKESVHHGGVAFDVVFNDGDAVKAPLNSSRNRKITKASPSTIVKRKMTNHAGNWADKQCDVFAGWLNYTLNPEEMEINSEGCVASGLRSLIVHRRLAEGRVNAFKFFNGDSMLQIRSIIRKEIARGRLSIREDRDVTADVHLRKLLSSLFLSYSASWLRVALEVMFGEYIEPVPTSKNSSKTHSGRTKIALDQFIKKRFLSDDNTLKKYTKGRGLGLSGAFGTRYKEEMRSLVLSRIMTLVFFLDRAKAANVLENAPRLFTISSTVKSTRDVLNTICRECLSSEGDIVKHLSRIGLKISYVQDPIDEVNFKISNLATDLRDGVILTRLSEIITGSSFKEKMSSLRLPAVSRLQKKFNVNRAFSILKDYGIVLADGINAHHVMDGHREMVLALMWCIIAQCSLEKLIQRDQVEQEILSVAQSSHARKKLEGKSFSGTEHAALNSSFMSSVEKDSSFEDIVKDLLLRWSQAVCSSFGVTIDDLSESFANGKALCLLVHYYHPSLIRIDDIFLESTESDSDEDTLGKEHRNWLKASRSMQELGGIPDMLPVCDSKNPPNEKAMLLCLSYLCSRLMESSREIFASILIQACYRNYSRKLLLERKILAASTIFRVWTRYRDNYFRQQERRYKIAVATVEDFVLSHKHALKRMKKARLLRELHIYSVTEIQRIFRGRLARARFERLARKQMAANIIQRTFRRYSAKQVSKALIHERDSAIIIQSAFRRFIAHEIYLDTCYFIVEIQRNVRGYFARRELRAMDDAAYLIQDAWRSHVDNTERELAAIKVQKIWRGIIGRRKSIEHAIYRDAASVIQKSWRGYYQYLVYSICIESSIVIQSRMRGCLARERVSVKRSRDAATSIQKIWRGFSMQVQYHIDLMDIVCVQSLVRRFLSKKTYRKRADALSTIQCSFRCSIARRNMLSKIHEKNEEILRFRSAVIIQARIRTFIARKNLYVLQWSAFVIQNQWRTVLRHRLMMSASTRIQSMYRSKKCRRAFLRSKMAVIDLQRTWRGFSDRQSNKLLSYAATLIQCAWRGYWVYSDYILYVTEMKAATLIQAHVRRVATKNTLQKKNSLARSIQYQWRAYKQFKLETSSAIKIQAMLRSNTLRSKFLEIKSASILLQQMARSHKARNVLYLKQREKQFEQAVITVQRIWRGFTNQVQFQMDMMDVICVQSLARRYIVSRTYKRSVSAICTVQRAFRCSMARQERTLRKYVLDTMVGESCVMIQKTVRGFISRSKYVKQRTASINIQRSWRGHTTRKYLAGLRQNATLIQNTWRMYSLRKRFMALKCSATKIQGCVRQFFMKSRYLAMQDVAVSLQRRWRGIVVRDCISKQHLACTLIQSNWRRSYAQNNYLLDLLEIKSATLIQASFRMYVHRLDYMVIKYSAHTIQRFTRGLLSRVDLSVKHFAATEIQRAWRGYSTGSVKSIITSVVKIQSFTRTIIAKKEMRTLRLLRWAEYRNRQISACVIQNTFRNYTVRKRRARASVIIQNAYRFYAERKRCEAASCGIIKFQARFRAVEVRKNRSKRVSYLAYRIKEETRRALLNPTLRLGYRTSRALAILQTSQSLTKIMDAVKELEASTRLSVVCCQVFTKVNAADILLQLIQSCNRSVPYMELKEHILLTLENVAQYPSLVGSFAHYKYAEVFLDNVQVFRDKDGIFCLAVVLLDQITKADASVAQFCATHEHLKRLKEVFRVVSGKKTRFRNKKIVSEKTKRLRKYGLAKRDDFDREASIKLLYEMISTFSKIEVLRVQTPNSETITKFDWNALKI